MKDIKEIIDECRIPFADIKQNYKTEYDIVFNREKDWLNNLEDKTHRLAENVKSDIDFVIANLKTPNYQFTSKDTPKLSIFVSKINGIIRIANRINNFKEGVSLDNGGGLHLYELFNAIKRSNKLLDLNFELNKNLNSFIPHLFSIVKHCQNPDSYPIYYRYWKNIFGEVLNQKDDYDSFCEFYESITSPKHLSLGAYFGSIGIILAKKITENEIIKEEGDKNYKYIRSKLLNIHYFDLITGYKRNPNYFLVGSKYGENNDVDVFPQMKERQVVSVGFASDLDLSEFYLTDENEIIEYLKEERQNQNAINALKHFLSIKIGDKVAVKASGSPKGSKGFLSIAGICEVVSNNNGEVYNYDPTGLGHTLNVKFLNTEYKEFELGGYGSTVHKLSKEDHIALIFEDSETASSIFKKVSYKFNKSVFESYIQHLRKITSDLNIKFNDERVVYSVRENRLNFTVGQRYCFNLYHSYSKGVYGVISKTKLADNSEAYEGNPPQPFYTYFQEFIPNSEDWSSIIESIRDELTRTSKSGFRRHNNVDFENFVFSRITEIKKDKMNYKTAYLEWLTQANFGDSGKPSSYIRAIDILSELLNNNIFEEDDLLKLDLLYKDLVIEQKNDGGKYYYKDAPSYGKSGFYSASIGAYIEFLKGTSSKSIAAEPLVSMKKRVHNKLAQAICVIGDSGVGKTYRVNKTLENEGHKTLFIIIDNMWQHILFDYSPIDRKYCLTKVGEFIKKAFYDVENNYTIVIDECHKNLEIINDVLLQAISTKRNDGVRFLALNSLVDKEFDFLPAINGNRVLPSNLGFLFISSKSDIIEGNDDLKNRIEIIELTESDQSDNDYTIDYLLSKIKKEDQSEYTN